MEKISLKRLPAQLTVLAKHLQKDLTNAGVYLVGGAVRDLILGRETKDYDLVVRGVDSKKLQGWLGDHGRVNLVGKTFGVFKWQPRLWRGEAIDVALPRTEHVAVGTGQYRDFTVQSNPKLNIEDDLARRDFTVNALALDLASSQLIDLNKGKADLEHKTLRTVGDPTARFSEDLSRTLRGIRFACQLDFKIERDTWAAIKVYAQPTTIGRIKNGTWVLTGNDGTLLVPREVIARELLKALIANPPRALELLDKGGFLRDPFFPQKELFLDEVAAMKGCPQPPEFHTEGDVFEHTKLALASFSTPTWKKFFGEAKPSLNVIIATLLHDIGKPLTLKKPETHGTNRIRTDEHDTVGAALVPQICERLKLTSYVDDVAGQVEVEVVRWLVEHHLLLLNDPEVLKPSTIYRYFLKDRKRGLELEQLIFVDSWASLPPSGKPTANHLKALQKRLPDIAAKLSHGKLEPLMSGHDIMKAFNLKPGPKVGALLALLETAQLEGSIKTKAAAKAWLKSKL